MRGNSRLHCTIQIIFDRVSDTYVCFLVPCVAGIATRMRRHGALIEMPPVTIWERSRNFALSYCASSMLVVGLVLAFVLGRHTGTASPTSTGPAQCRLFHFFALLQRSSRSQA